MLGASIQGRSVIVTGASKGIGKGIARVFADHGAKVLLVARDLKGRSSWPFACLAPPNHGYLLGNRPMALARRVEEPSTASTSDMGHVDIWDVRGRSVLSLSPDVLRGNE